MDTQKPRQILYVFMLAQAMLAAACAAAALPPAGEAGALRPIPVADVRIEIGLGSPIPVEVLVSGTWPDLCAQLAEVTQRLAAGSIDITLLATGAEPDCPPDYVGVPFRLAVPLNGVELPEGTYTVSVNGVATTLTWPAPGQGS